MKIFKAKIFIIFLLVLNSFSIVKGYNSMTKQTIAIDLDGVLDNYTKYTDEIPEIKKGAKEFIEELSKDYELILFTTRNTMQATKWLIKYDIDRYFKDVTNVKPLSVMFLDDRAVQFNGDYNKALEDIKNFKVDWK